jgi:type VI secretion system protein ImpJ
VAGLPLLEALLASGRAHPFQLYLALAQIAGNVAPLGPSMVPPTLTPYRHENLRASFAPLMANVLKTLTEGISEVYTAFPFRLEKNSFKLHFRREWMDRRLLLAMRAAAGTPDKDVVMWGESALIGSSPSIESMRQRRVLGAQRQYAPSDEELLVTRGVALFTLTPDTEYTIPGEVLEIVEATDRPEISRPSEVILYVRNT